MTKKSNNLAAALKKNSEEEQRQKSVAPLTNRPVKAGPSSRKDLVNIAGWFPKPVKHMLEELRLKRQRELDQNVTKQNLMAEAYNDLFIKHGLPPVAATRED